MRALFGAGVTAYLPLVPATDLTNVDEQKYMYFVFATLTIGWAGSH